MGTCDMCGKVRRLANVGSGSICAECTEKKCPCCNMAIAKTERNTRIIDIAYSYTDGDGSQRHVQAKMRVHTPLDDDHQRFFADPGTFLRIRREANIAMARASQPITPAAPRFRAVPDTTVAP